MIRLINPKFFVPIHGEYHANYPCTNCNDCVPEENCFIMDNGDVLALTSETAEVTGKVPSVRFILTEVY